MAGWAPDGRILVRGHRYFVFTLAVSALQWRSIPVTPDPPRGGDYGLSPRPAANFIARVTPASS